MTITERVQSAFYRTFYKWGHFVGRCPLLVILVSFVLALLGASRLATAFGSNPLPSVVEQEELWVPQEAQAITDKATYDSIFTTSFRRNTIYFTGKPRGRNILTKDVLSEIRRFDEMVTSELNATHWGGGARAIALKDEDGNKAVGYEDVCAKSTASFGSSDSDDDDGGIPACILFGHPLELFYRVGGIFTFDYTDKQINELVTTGRGHDKQIFPDSSDRTVNVNASYGGITRDKDGKVTGAKAIAITYLLDEHPVDSTARRAAEAWEDQLNHLAGTSPAGASWTYPDLSQGPVSDGRLVFTSDKIEVYPQTAGATSRELSRNIQGDLTALQLSFFIILLYAIFIFSRCHPVRSRILLALSGCLSVGLSIAVAYGFTVTLGFKLNPVINVLPFILIGIGVDDMFVLTAALDAQPADLPVKERIGRAMGSAGVSITITSLTDLFAFALGTSSSLPALSTFCVFAAIGIAADFLLQISFFAGFMAWDAYRERRNKVDCCPCCVKTEKQSGCCCFTCCYDKFNCVENVNKGNLPSCCKCGPLEMLLVLCVGGLKAWMVRYYIPLLRKKSCKIFVLVTFTLYAAISAYYASLLKQDFQFRWFVNDDAALQQAFDVQDDYYNSTGLPVYVVTPASSEVDYASIEGQRKLLALSAAVGASKWIDKDSVSDWYTGFREWVHECGTSKKFDSGPLDGVTCRIRSCFLNSSWYGIRKVYPYCSTKKVERDEDGEALTDKYGFTIPSGYEDKFLVKADGTSRAGDGINIEETFVPPERFWRYLDQYVEDSPLGQLAASEIIWVKNVTVRTPEQVSRGIRATRIRATYDAVDKADDQVDSMQTLRADVAKVKFGNSFAYMPLFLFYEQYAIILREALLNLGLALVAVFFIVMLVLANVACTLMVMGCVLVVDCDILGLMQMWGLTIDSVSIINLVLAIGLAVDYSVHVAHAFLQTPGTRQERVDKALEEMGTAVVHGCFSTFLAVLILSTSQSYIFRIFFKQFFGIVIFGGAHGLVFLPTVLSLVGPAYVPTGFHQSTKESQVSSSTEMSKGGANVVATSSESIPTLPPTPPTENDDISPSLPPSPPASRGMNSARLNSARVAPSRGFAPHVV